MLMVQNQCVFVVGAWGVLCWLRKSADAMAGFSVGGVMRLCGVRDIQAAVEVQ